MVQTILGYIREEHAGRRVGDGLLLAAKEKEPFYEKTEFSHQTERTAWRGHDAMDQKELRGGGNGMKTIGLIGGMSWESTVTYYQIMNETGQRIASAATTAQRFALQCGFRGD